MDTALTKFLIGALCSTIVIGEDAFKIYNRPMRKEKEFPEYKLPKTEQTHNTPLEFGIDFLSVMPDYVLNDFTVTKDKAEKNMDYITHDYDNNNSDKQKPSKKPVPIPPEISAESDADGSSEEEGTVKVSKSTTTKEQFELDIPSQFNEKEGDFVLKPDTAYPVFSDEQINKRKRSHVVEEANKKREISSTSSTEKEFITSEIIEMLEKEEKSSMHVATTEKNFIDRKALAHKIFDTFTTSTKSTASERKIQTGPKQFYEPSFDFMKPIYFSD